MKLIIGLGNPGGKYIGTRHNLGFMIADQFLKDFTTVNHTVWNKEEKVKSDVAHIDWQTKTSGLEKVLLAKPLTFMNNSGMAANLLTLYYRIEPSDIWIIHDELDLPFGSMKIRLGGAAAGHHGVESIINTIGTDKFWRFRMGIGLIRAKDEVAHHLMHNVDDYVLGKFSHEQTGRVHELIAHGSKALQYALEHGMKAAMNKYNNK